MGDVVALSRRLSYVLRHHPESVGIHLDPAGWVDVEVLLRALADDGLPVTRADLEAVMTEIPKQRFEARDGRIRATHGHSIEVDLGLEEQAPPATLYHGTVRRFLAAIREEGLRPGSRQHVHLSPDVPTAREVGSRRGRPVVLEVAAGQLHADGHPFHRAADGVWLTDAVPAAYLTSWTAEPPRAAPPP